MKTSHKPVRERVLDTATDLFYREGIRAVGVDTIVEKSGVGKSSLYRHFSTKDDLIVAYLEKQEEHHSKWYDEALAQYEGSPYAQLVAFIDTTIETMMEPGYRGCYLLNALAEISNVNHPAYSYVLKYKESFQMRLSHLTRQAGAQDETLANQLMIVINGALVSVSLVGATIAATQLKMIATQLINSAFRQTQEE
jgi:AcrR family transcriptional regulator